MKQKRKSLSSVERLKEERLARKMEVLDKAILIFRPFDLPMCVRPIRLTKKFICPHTKKSLYSGDYGYPCHINPIRLSTSGRYRIELNAALQLGDKILAAGCYATMLPSTENLLSLKQFKEIEDRKKSVLNKHTLKLLKAA